MDLQAGEGRRGRNASQSTHGRCFSSGIAEQFTATGAVQAIRQFVNVQGEHNRMYDEHRPSGVSTRKGTVSMVKEQEEIGTRSRESQCTVFTGLWRQEVAPKGSDS